MATSVCVYCGGHAGNRRGTFTVCPGHLDLPDIDPYINDRIFDRSEPEEYRPAIVNAALITPLREAVSPPNGTGGC